MLKKPVRGATVAVQGYGNAGAISARLLHEDGARLVALSDSQGGIYSSRGLDPRTVARAQAADGLRGRLQGRGAHHQRGADRAQVRRAGAAALENQITLRNASRVRARIVAEAANGPTTPGADRVLRDHGVCVIPDVLCNAGGVTVSYFEWAQNLQGFLWEEAVVNRELERFMKRAFHEVHETSRTPQGGHADRRLHAGGRPRGRGHPRAGPVPMTR